MKKATLYVKEFHTSKVILTFSIFSYHFGEREIAMNRPSVKYYNRRGGKFQRNSLTAQMLLRRKNTCDTFNIFFCRRKQMLSSGKKFFKKIASRCDRSKILFANKLCKKPDRVIPA